MLFVPTPFCYSPSPADCTLKCPLLRLLCYPLLLLPPGLVACLLPSPAVPAQRLLLIYPHPISAAFPSPASVQATACQSSVAQSMAQRGCVSGSAVHAMGRAAGNRQTEQAVQARSKRASQAAASAAALQSPGSATTVCCAGSSAHHPWRRMFMPARSTSSTRSSWEATMGALRGSGTRGRRRGGRGGWGGVSCRLRTAWQLAGWLAAGLPSSARSPLQDLPLDEAVVQHTRTPKQAPETVHEGPRQRSRTSAGSGA